MPVKRIPPRRLGITKRPGKTEVSFDRPLNRDGSRPISKDEEAALKEILEGVPDHPLTFSEETAHIESLCRRIIEQHGGVPAAKMPREWEKGTMRAGYALPVLVTEASELDFALKILRHILRAGTHDIEEARKHAWRGGELHAEAAMKFLWEKETLIGIARKQQMTEWAAKGTTARRRVSQRKNEVLKAKVTRCLKRHPDWSIRSVAASFLAVPARVVDGEEYDGVTVDAETNQKIEALAARIRRLGLKSIRK